MPITDPKVGSAQDQQRRVRAQLVGATKRRILKAARHEARRMDEELEAKLRSEIERLDATLKGLVLMVAGHLSGDEKVTSKGIDRLWKQVKEQKKND